MQSFITYLLSAFALFIALTASLLILPLAVWWLIQDFVAEYFKTGSKA